MGRVGLFDREIVWSWFSTFRSLHMDVLCVGDKLLSTDDDTDCEERGGEEVNNIIQQKSTWATKKRQKLGCYLPLEMLLFHTNTYIYIKKIRREVKNIPSSTTKNKKNKTIKNDLRCYWWSCQKSSWLTPLRAWRNVCC